MQEKFVGVCLLVGLVGIPVVTGSAVVENEPPLVDAGLDQETSAGHTVWLDATGSRDPDGSIRSYEWTITAPNRTTLTPVCETCGQTRFVPTSEGRYNVTVTVTDDDGASRSDTLYVDVNGTVLSVELTGESEPQVGTSHSYTVDLAHQQSVEMIRWRSNRSLDRTVRIDGEIQSRTTQFRFDDARPRELMAIVTTADGQRATAELVVDPYRRADSDEDMHSETETYEFDDHVIIVERAETVITENGIETRLPEDRPTGQDLGNFATSSPGQYDTSYHNGGGGSSNMDSSSTGGGGAGGNNIGESGDPYAGEDWVP